MMMLVEEFELLSSKPISELNKSELKTIYEIRNSYEMPESGTLMSKVIPDGTFKNYINNGEYSKTVVGCVAKAQDTAGLKTYNDYFNTFGLGYDGSPYKNPAKDSMYVMRLQQITMKILRYLLEELLTRNWENFRKHVI